MIILNAQTRSKDRPSLKYSSGGSGPLWRYDGPAFSLPTGGGGGQYIIYEESDSRMERERGEDSPVPIGQETKHRTRMDTQQTNEHSGHGTEPSTRPPRYFEMFAGVGGFSIGINRGYENSPHQQVGNDDSTRRIPSIESGSKPQLSGSPNCIGFSEIDPHASAVLRYHYPNVKNYGDCTKINWSEVPDFDLLVGGSPCQDFSIAGKRAGLVGARSGLAYEYIRALEEKRPARFIWENVRGVLSSNRGWDFAAILNQMAQAGYSLQWQVLNAKHFGVPQNRERVFVIGTRSDLGSPREVFFEQGAGGQDIQNLERGAGQADRRYDTSGISPTIPTAGGGATHPDDNGSEQTK